MHIMDILEHGICSELLFPRTYHYYNENVQIWNIFFSILSIFQNVNKSL